MESKDLRIRKAAAAGSFYPGTAIELTKRLADLFTQADKVAVVGQPQALIVPHAGYNYSGHTAAKAYKLLEGYQYDTVVVISPSHTVFYKGASVFDGDGYETPMGIVEIDHELSEKLARINPSVYLSGMGHASGATRGDHTLEVQLPFLQMVLGKFKLVAIVMGDQEEETVRALGEALASGLKGSNSLLVASSDLSQFHNEKQARQLDQAIRKAVEEYDPDLLLDTLENGSGEACGGGVMAAVMMASRRLGAKNIKFLEYTTSGETTGSFDEVVGYLSAAITSDQKPAAGRPALGEPRAIDPEAMAVLTDEDKKQLLKIAREAIRARLHNKKYSPPVTENVAGRRGMYVTIKIDGKLRGHIGRIRSDLPMYESVAEMSRAAAFEEPHLSDLTESDFKKLEVEISVLSPLKREHDLRKIEVGRHGLMIKLDLNSGLILPQTAVSNDWNRVQFLEQTCLKAGLPKNSYKDKNAEVYTFTADVFQG